MVGDGINSDDPQPPLPAELNENVIEATVHKLEALGLEFATSTNPKLEKMGLERFRRYDARYPPVESREVVHILDQGERDLIRAIGRRVMWLAFGIGALSGLASSVAAFLLAVPEGTLTTTGEDVLEFAVANGVTIIATLIEVALLYRVALKAVHRIARVAGIRLVPRGDRPETDEERAVALALARAALELPNPPQNAFGIDPYQNISKWRIVLATIFYKLKISLTNFVLRIVIRRIGGRAIVKAYLAFTDIFVTGMWDALVAGRMIRQARIRALGPSACEALLRDILQSEHGVRREVLATMLRAVATTIVRSREVHPNLLALMRSIQRRAGAIVVPDLDDAAAFLAALDRLSGHERSLVLEVLVLASFPDGRVMGAEMKYLQVVLEREGYELDRHELQAVRRAFVRGDAIEREALQRVMAPAS